MEPPPAAAKGVSFPSTVTDYRETPPAKRKAAEATSEGVDSLGLQQGSPAWQPPSTAPSTAHSLSGASQAGEMPQLSWPEGGKTPTLAWICDMLPHVAVHILAQLSAADLVSVGLASRRLVDLSEIAARRIALRSQNRKGLTAGGLGEVFDKLSTRCRWKRLLACSECAGHFACLACVECPISPEEVLVYLCSFHTPSIAGALAATMGAHAQAPTIQTALSRGVAQFMAGSLVPALYDFLSTRERMFINASHDDFVVSSTKAECVCEEGFSFTGAGLGGSPGAAAPNPNSIDAVMAAIMSSQHMALGRLCALKLFMPPWFGLEPLTTPRVPPPAFGSRQRNQGRAGGDRRTGPRQPLPLTAPSSEERSLASQLLCGRCHPDSWVQSQPEELQQRCRELLALPVCTGPQVLLGRVFDCACFAMAGAESPVVAFLAHASPGAPRVTARDAWVAIIKNMPWCEHDVLAGLGPQAVIASGVIDLSGGWVSRDHSTID